MTGRGFSNKTKRECQVLIRRLLLERGEMTANQLYQAHLDICTFRNQMRSTHRLAVIAKTTRGVMTKLAPNGNLIYYMV